MKKRLFTLLLALAMLFTSACGAETVDDSEAEETEENYTPTGKVLEEAAVADRLFTLCYEPEKSMNPLMAQSEANMELSSLMYDTVFELTEDFNYESDIVTEINTEDNIWWVFTIDQTVTFHDGTNLTAYDVAYSINQARITSYYEKGLACVYGCSAIDDGRFAITTAYANSLLPSLLTVPIVQSGCGVDWCPPGTGPYKISGDGTYLEVYEGYRDQTVTMPIDRIYLRSCTDAAEKINAFESSEIDLVTNDKTGLSNLGYGSANETRYLETTNMHYIGFNFQSNFFQNAEMRRGVQYLIDRDYVVETLMDGCGVTTTLPVSPVSGLYDSTYAETLVTDTEKAKLAFQRAGVSDLDGDGTQDLLVTGIIVRVNISFIVNSDRSVKVQAARRIAEAMNEIGIPTTLRELSYDDYIEALETGDYDMYYAEMRLTPDWNLSPLFEEYEDPEEKGLNYANCFDAQYGLLYESYLGSDAMNRKAQLSSVCTYIAENAAIVPICFECREILTHRAVVTGIYPAPNNIYYNFHRWTINP